MKKYGRLKIVKDSELDYKFSAIYIREHVMTTMTMIRNFLISGLMAIPFIANGQVYQFKEPKNCRTEILLSDSFGEKHETIGDTLSISYFDKIGNKIKSIEKNNGQVISFTSYKYDNLGNLIETRNYGVMVDSNVNFHHLDTTFVSSIIKYQYENGLLKQTNEFSRKNKMKSSLIYDYDSLKRIVEELSITYPDKNTLVYNQLNSKELDWKNPKQLKLETYTTKNKYFKNLRISTYSDSVSIIHSDTSIISDGLITKTTSFDSKGELLCETDYKYINKKLVEYSVDGCELDIGIPANRFVYEYDEYGDLASEYFYDKDRLLRKDYYKRIKY